MKNPTESVKTQICKNMYYLNGNRLQMVYYKEWDYIYGASFFSTCLGY